MTEHHSIKIPEFGNFEMRYYIENGEQKQTPRIFPPHIHDKIELYMLLEGDVSFLVDNKMYRLHPYDAVISKPNELHNCILNSESKHRHLCFWFTAGSDFLFSDFLRKDAENSSLLCPDDNDRQLVADLCRKLILCDSAPDAMLEFSLGMELLAVLRRTVTHTAMESEPMPKTLCDILADIDENLPKINLVDELCRRHFISRSSLERLFRGYLHTTPKQYLETKRLAYSRIMLSQGESVSQACMKAGFHDLSNYIRLFKKQFGITPGAYSRR